MLLMTHLLLHSVSLNFVFGCLLILFFALEVPNVFLGYSLALLVLLLFLISQFLVLHLDVLFIPSFFFQFFSFNPLFFFLFPPLSFFHLLFQKSLHLLFLFLPKLP